MAVMSLLTVAALDPDEFIPLPETGRRVTRVRSVRLSDVDRHGMVVLDALA